MRTGALGGIPDNDCHARKRPGDYTLERLSRACRGERTPETELIVQSIRSTEPGGGHMIELARAILNSPVELP